MIIQIVPIGKANKNAKSKDFLDQLHQRIAIEIQR